MKKPVKIEVVEMVVRTQCCSLCGRETDAKVSKDNGDLLYYVSEGYAVATAFGLKKVDPDSNWDVAGQDMPARGIGISIQGNYFTHDLGTLRGFWCVDCYNDKVVPALESVGAKIEGWDFDDY